MNALELLESANGKLNEAIAEIQQALDTNQELKDYYGYTLSVAKEAAGDCQVKVERAIETEGEKWNN